MGHGWRQSLLGYAGLLLIALMIAGHFGYPWLGLFCATFIYLVWHLVNLYRLERWLRKGRQFNTPESIGVWGDVFQYFYRLRRRDRERKRRMARLLREFRDSTGAMPDGVVVLNRLGEIRWFNRAAARLLDLRVPQDVGQRIANLIRHPDFIRYVKRGDYEEAVEISSELGGDLRLTLQIVPYAESQQLLLVRDVTRLHRLEHVRREFVANASHELRTPLTVIAGYLDALNAERGMPVDWHAPLREMQQQSSRMGAIVEDLLELSRLENETGEAAYQKVDIVGMLSRIRGEALALGQGPHDVILAISTDAQLLGAEHEIYSAFANLVFNAMKYTPSDGQVTVSWQMENKGASFSVEDTGIGIPAEHIPRLTERFYRVDPSRSRDSGGTGLGLAIVKHALQHHTARLEIRSTPGKGSTFICHFPPSRVYRPEHAVEH
ncbi:MAG: phosphate regulon sensor histidine kinase PhoR [Gammaproteobacteria bacterium]